MTPSYHAFLINGRRGDPALYVDARFAKRALLFDLGDLHSLEPRKILRLSDVFVSHTHIDHFIGFDRLLRVLLGRDKCLNLFGPEGIIDRVAAKLGGYSWNLVERFATELVFEVIEVASATEGHAARFRLSKRFAREDLGKRKFGDGMILDDHTFAVRVAVVDHGLPCLIFAIEEPAHVNIWRNRLEDLGLSTGPWLSAFKRAVIDGAPDTTPIAVSRKDSGGAEDRLPLGTLKREIASIVAGQKIAYVTDVAPTAENERAVEELAADADILFIEATFARADAALAAERDHLTTEMAGRIGAAARARRVEPFHFSPRYDREDAEGELLAEVEAAFRQRRTRQPE